MGPRLIAAAVQASTTWVRDWLLHALVAALVAVTGLAWQSAMSNQALLRAQVERIDQEGARAGLARFAALELRATFAEQRTSEILMELRYLTMRVEELTSALERR